MNWPIISISDFCKTGSGGTPSRSKIDKYYGGHIPWIKSGELYSDIITSAEEFITNDAVAESSAKLIPSGAILVAMYGATVGQTSILGIEATTNQAICHLVPKSDIATNRYVWYALKTKIPELLTKRVGGAQPNISQQIIKKTKIPLPPLSEQRRIVEILDQADALRKKRAEADAKAEQILPALFIKMFGDPISNPYDWDIVPLKDLFSDEKVGTKCGPFGSALKRHEYINEGIPVWGIDNVAPNAFVEKGSLFITQDKYEELTSYSVDSGDILISRAGTVGRMCVAYPKQSPSIIGTNLIRLSLKSKEIAPEYFSSMFTYFPDRVGQLRASSDESAYSFMNTSVLKSLNIPLPPFKLQQVFVSSINQLRLQNRKTADSGKVLETLFQTLLYRAFSGDLTAEWRKVHMTQLLQEMEHQARVLGLEREVQYEQLGILK